MTCSKLYIGGNWVDGASTFVVTDKFTGDPIASVAVQAAATAFAGHKLTLYARYEILHRAALLVESRRSAFSSAIVSESGFTVSDAENEVARAVQTLLGCAEEAKRIAGEVVPLRGAS